MEEFRLGTPAVVCRWRLANGSLPLESRHIKALAARSEGVPVVTTSLVAWAKQHIEWTLRDGSAQHPNGVLMLVVDVDGQAAMTVGEYSGLERTTANDLLTRAQNAREEARASSVSPEDLWVVRDNALVWGTCSEFSASGTSSLVDDLARTLGIPVQRDEYLLSTLSAKGFGDAEVFLASDEHGVVPASDHGGSRAQKFADSYRKLLVAKTRRA